MTAVDNKEVSFNEELNESVQNPYATVDIDSDWFY